MKNKNTAWLLALFLWGLWVHRFYLWKNISWVFYILFCFTFIPMIIWIIEAFYLWGISEEKFKKEYWVEVAIKCKFCQEDIKEWALKCKHCNSNLWWTEKE